MELETTREAAYDYIKLLLTSGATQQTCAAHVDELVDTIRSAAHDACADFAEDWNAKWAGLALGRLPTEVLIMCFRRVPFYDRVSASHVSRAWRAAALGDPMLWATFSRTEPDHVEDDTTQKLIAQLSAMLERSRSAPFELRVPMWNRGFSLLEERLADVVQPELGRIQSYEGSFQIYMNLNPDGAAMPHLRYLKLFSSAGTIAPVFHLPLSWDNIGAPVLSRIELDGVALSIPSACAALPTLRNLDIYSTPVTNRFASPGPENLESLFQLCPNLVTLEVRRVTSVTRLPRGPLPHTLEMVSLYGANDRAVCFDRVLAPWIGFPVRHLELYGTRTLSHPLSLFLSSCRGQIEIEMSRHTVHLRQTAPAPCLYVVQPFVRYYSTELEPLRGAGAARLTCLSVHSEHLGTLLAAHLHAPRLSDFELQLDDHTEPPMPGPAFCLVAPRLRRVRVRIPDMDPGAAGDTDSHCARAVFLLRDCMRELLQYDAALLDSITVYGPRETLAALSCAQLAPLAATYTEQFTHSI